MKHMLRVVAAVVCCVSGPVALNAADGVPSGVAIDAASFDGKSPISQVIGGTPSPGIPAVPEAVSASGSVGGGSDRGNWSAEASGKTGSDHEYDVTVANGMARVLYRRLIGSGSTPRSGTYRDPALDVWDTLVDLSYPVEASEVINPPAMVFEGTGPKKFRLVCSLQGWYENGHVMYERENGSLSRTTVSCSVTWQRKP